MFGTHYQVYLLNLLRQFKKKEIEEDQIIFAAQHFLYAIRLNLQPI